MIGTTVSTRGGARIVLGDQLGRGGEGNVFGVRGDNSRAAKIIHPDKIADRRDKIVAMVALGLAGRSQLAAFPIEELVSGGAFTGFTMRRAIDHRLIVQLWNPSFRQTLFPGADFAFLVRVAANAARAIASVHYAGCIVGDLNESGLLVSKGATVALIDADSFQFDDRSRRYLCRVFKREFNAPELAGFDPARDPRSRNHDAFALAGIVFRLLFLGRGPFNGVPHRPEIELDTAIVQHRFAYSRRRDTELSPPPGAPTLGDVSPEIADLFEDAFAPVGMLGLRPRALDWVAPLERFERDLVDCRAQPSHRYHPHAGGCSWCRIAAATGMDLFAPAP